jgi:DNA-binding LacI/PurR family transcriptional regulator
MAFGALRALREAGTRVPKEVAVVGFDDLPQAAESEPPLTTMQQPIERAGVTAAETLLELVQKPGSAPRSILLPTELVIRKSCGGPPPT